MFFGVYFHPFVFMNECTNFTHFAIELLLFISCIQYTHMYSI